LVACFGLLYAQCIISKGCSVGTGVTSALVVDTQPCTNSSQNICFDSFWKLCPIGGTPPDENTQKCSAEIYGGVYGSGTTYLKNPGGNPNPWSNTYTVQGGPFNNIYGAYVGIEATIDSGYLTSNQAQSPTPYQLSLQIQGQPAGVFQLTDILRNPYWLVPRPSPLPSDMDFRTMLLPIPSSLFSYLQGNGGSVEVSVEYTLLTLGWIVFNSSWIEIQSCAPQTCVCYSDAANGFWAGSGCSTCQSGYSGPNCDIPLPEVEHTGGLKAGVAIMTILTVAFMATTAFFWHKARKAGRGESHYMLNASKT